MVQSPLAARDLAHEVGANSAAPCGVCMDLEVELGGRRNRRCSSAIMAMGALAEVADHPESPPVRRGHAVAVAHPHRIALAPCATHPRTRPNPSVTITSGRGRTHDGARPSTFPPSCCAHRLLAVADAEDRHAPPHRWRRGASGGASPVEAPRAGPPERITPFRPHRFEGLVRPSGTEQFRNRLFLRAPGAR